MGDEDAPTGVAPTVLGVVEDNTAWALDDVEDEPPKPRRVLAGVFVGAALAAAVGGLAVAVTLAMKVDDRPTPQAPVQAVVKPSRTITLTQPDQDTAFLMELDKTGIMYDTAGAAVHNAAVVCKAVASGRSESQVVESFAEFREMGPAEAAPFVAISIQHYCPRNSD